MDSEDSKCRENVEEGEITDDSANEASEGYIPITNEDLEQEEQDDQDYNEDDDEAPENVLNRIAKLNSAKSEMAEDYNQNICFICRDNPYKYRCPKCDVRTCSLNCINAHKEIQRCDGVRPPFNPLKKLSQFDAGTSIKDQSWMHNMHNTVYNDSEPETHKSAHSQYQNREEDYTIEKRENNDEANSSVQDNDQQANRQFPQYINEDGTRNSANSAVERFLLPNAYRRRIFLSFSGEKETGEDNSRHEQFSDSIFWCIDFIFRRQQEDGSFSDYSYRVQNIPETIRICTVLKQFLKPRKYGCVVSESDLDLEKLKKFIEIGIEGLALFMKVPRFEKERYYVINADKTILENTRNRVVVDHPKLIIIIGNECVGMTTLSENEAEDLRNKLQKERNMQLNTQGVHRRGRGSGRGFHGPGNFRGGPRGGFRGAGFIQNNNRSQPGMIFPQKRHHDQHPSPQEWKRGKGEWRGRGRGGNRQSYNNANHEIVEAFDPFEPFKGTNTLPADYGMPAETKNDYTSFLNWENINSKLGESTKPSVPPRENEYVVSNPHSFG